MARFEFDKTVSGIYQTPLLVRAAVAVPLNSVCSVGGLRFGNVQNFLAVPRDEFVKTGIGRDEFPEMVASAVFRPLNNSRSFLATGSVNVEHPARTLVSQIINRSGIGRLPFDSDDPAENQSQTSQLQQIIFSAERLAVTKSVGC